MLTVFKYFLQNWVKKCNLNRNNQQMKGMKILNYRFGLYPENTVPKSYWGARAIFWKGSDYKLDIPRERQTFEGEKEDSKELMNWINSTFLIWLGKQADSNFYNHCQNKLITLDSEDGRFHGQACSNKSYGYMYIGCWEN